MSTKTAGYGIRFGTGTGGQSQRGVVPDQSPFANAADVESWALANLANLRNSTGEDAQVTVIVINDTTGFPDADQGIKTYQWGGLDQPTDYTIDKWIIFKGQNAAEIKQLYESNNNTNAFEDAEKASVSHLRSVSDELFIEGSPKAEATGMFLGDVVRIKDHGNLLGVDYATDTPPNNVARIPDYVSPTDSASGKIRRFATGSTVSKTLRLPFDPPRNTPDDISEIPFNFTINDSDFDNGSLSRAFYFDATSEIVNFRFRLAVASTGKVLKYWPSKEVWLDGGDGSTLPIGEIKIDLDDSPFFAFNDEYSVTIRFATGGTFLSSLSSVMIPSCRADFQLGEYIFSADALTYSSLISSASPYSASPNEVIRIGLGNNVTINLPDSVNVGDAVIISEIVNIVGTNKMMIQTTNSSLIRVNNTDGTVLEDTQITTAQNRYLPVYYTNEGWTVYNYD